MAKSLLDSKELKEIWEIKDEAYKEVADCKSINEMVLKRIKICKNRASRFRKKLQASR